MPLLLRKVRSAFNRLLASEVGGPMSGQAWSCFAQLPPGLIDPGRTLTLNWLRPPPTPEGFGLSRSDVDARRYARIVWAQRAALTLLAVLGSSIGFAFVAELAVDRDLSTAAAAVSAAAAAVVVLSAREIIRYRQVEPRRQAFEAAAHEFAAIDAWRAERCDPKFWRSEIDAAGFELESAELLAGVFATGQVALTRASDDYGVDILACAPAGRIVARCRQSERRIGAAAVRELAGAKAFFAADQAIMISLERPLDEGEQTNRIAERLELSFWNAEAIVAWARRLRGGA